MEMGFHYAWRFLLPLVPATPQSLIHMRGLISKLQLSLIIIN